MFSTLLISKWILMVLIDDVEGLLCAGDDWVQTSSPSESWLKAYKGHWWGKRVALSPIISLFCCHSERQRLRGSIHRCIHNSHFLSFFFFFYLAEWGFLCYNLARKLLGNRLPAIRRQRGHPEWQKWYYLSHLFLFSRSCRFQTAS